MKTLCSVLLLVGCCAAHGQDVSLNMMQQIALSGGTCEKRDYAELKDLPRPEAILLACRYREIGLSQKESYDRTLADGKKIGLAYADTEQMAAPFGVISGICLEEVHRITNAQKLESSELECKSDRADKHPLAPVIGNEEIRIAVPDSPTPAPAAAPVVPATAPAPAEAANVETVSAVQPQPTTTAAPVMPATAPPPAEGAKFETVSAVQPQLTGGESLGDAAKRNKQHKACLELAKDNPSIICK